MDDVERDYLRPILEADEPPAAARAGGPPIMGFAPAEPFALHGCVLTPTRSSRRAAVDIEGSTIAPVGTTAPAAGSRRVETDGVILPGLIDLHGHPEFNVFAAWEPPKRSSTATRGAPRPATTRSSGSRWTSSRSAPSSRGTALRRDPRAGRRHDRDPGRERDATESRGVARAQRRPVDLRVATRRGSMIDLDRTPPPTIVEAAGRRSRNGEVTAVYIHLAEGVRRRALAQGVRSSSIDRTAS